MKTIVKVVGVALCMCVVASGVWGKTITITPVSNGRNLTLADNQVGAVFQFKIDSDDTVSVEALHVDVALVSGTVAPGDRFIRSVLLFNDAGTLLSEQELQGEVSGSIRLRVCETVLKNVPKVYSVVVQGGYAGDDRDNTITADFTYSWIESDADTALTEAPYGEVVLGVYADSGEVSVARSNDVLEGVIPGCALRKVAAFIFNTSGESKTIVNPTFEFTASKSAAGFRPFTLNDANGRRLSVAKIQQLADSTRYLLIFPCKLKVLPGGTTITVLGNPGSFRYGSFAVSARAFDMFPVGDSTGIQTRVQSETCLVPGPTMSRR